MLKRARRLAVDFFSNIRETYLKPKEQQAKKNKNEDGAQGEITTTSDSDQSSTKLRNSASIKNVSVKHKRHTISSKKKARHTAASLPTPLNSDPDWQSFRERSNSDPPTPTSTLRKSKRTKSELSLRRSTSLGKEPLVRRRSLLKKKLELGISADAVSPEKTGSPSPSEDRPQGKFQVSFSVDETSIVERLPEDKLVDPIGKAQRKSEPGPTFTGESKPRARENTDWAARRKATSFLNVKDAVSAEESFERHNEEIMLIWDKMMAREIDDVRAKYDTQISEVLEEILLRESAAPTKDNAASPPAGHLRKGSGVAFNNTVEVVEVGHDGVIRTSSSELLEITRPRSVSRTIAHKKGSRKPSPLSVSADAAALRRSTSPVLTPTSSSPTKPPTPTNSSSSPRRSPLPFFGSPLFSPIQPTHAPSASPIISPSISPVPSPSSSPASSPSSSPISSPNSSPATRARNSLDAAASPKSKASVRPWTKVLAGRSHKTRSHEVGGHAVERAVEEEIAQVLDKYEREKLELLEEIELRETLDAALRFESERNELLAEIAFREAHPVLSPTSRRRFAVRLGNTLAQRAANGMDATMRKGDETIAKEKIERNAKENIEKLKIGAEISVVKRHRSVVWRKNASLRAVSRNATRKNLWFAEVSQALVKVGQ